MTRKFLQRKIKNLNAEKHSPTSSVQSTKRWVWGMLMSVGVESFTDRSRSDSVHEQVAKRIVNVRFTNGLRPKRWQLVSMEGIKNEGTDKK